MQFKLIFFKLDDCFYSLTFENNACWIRNEESVPYSLFKSKQGIEEVEQIN